MQQLVNYGGLYVLSGSQYTAEIRFLAGVRDVAKPEAAIFFRSLVRLVLRERSRARRFGEAIPHSAGVDANRTVFRCGCPSDVRRVGRSCLAE